MKIMKSQIDSTIVLSELAGKRPEVNYTIRLSRISLAGETAWATYESWEPCGTANTSRVRYFSSLSDVLNYITSIISDDEQKQLLRAL